MRSISIPEDMEAELDAYSSASGVPQDDLVRKAIADFLFVRRFRDVRERMLEHVERDHPSGYSDEDIFRMIS
jgi:Ribbon-helix-helix domain